MKLLLINSVCGVGSTGRICADIAKEYEEKGWEARIAYGRYAEVPDDCRKYAVRIGNRLDILMHVAKTRLFDACGFGSKRATERFLEWAESYKPDVLWLHNIHGYYVNVELLFQWIKKHPEMEVKWTLHDCWAFTGHCVHFASVKCNKWITGCKECPQKREYPSSNLLDCCEGNYEKKRALFNNVNNLSIVTPSIWLEQQVKKSFLGCYPVTVQHNVIDTAAFRPRESLFREHHQINGKIVVLGVASHWNNKKGLQDFYYLQECLDDRFCIVLVGRIDMGQKRRDFAKKESEKRIIFDARNEPIQSIVETEHGICISQNPKELYKTIIWYLKKMDMIDSTNRTKSDYNKRAQLVNIPSIDDKIKLAEIYSTADLFVNPTYEDTYPTVNLEAKACGTFIITYDTGGCRETI